MTVTTGQKKSCRQARPLIKWAGGKQQLLTQYASLFPSMYNKYLEPMVGGGACFFFLRPGRAVLIDQNEELVNFYKIVQSRPEDLFSCLKKHINDSAYYYLVRAQDPKSLSPVERASRFLFLNKTGYNGLWRVNKEGRHNVPFGRYKNPRYADWEMLMDASGLLEGCTILCSDFQRVLEYAEPGDFIYFDPPYYPLSRTASFTGYTSGSFSEKDQVLLAETFVELTRRGCLVMESNSDTPFVRETYRDYDLRVVKARRAINCRPGGRGPVTELVIRNYTGP
ncbi:MAG: DNA adenine methylase [Bacillota bacterium]